MSDFFPQFASPGLPIDLSTILSTFDVDKLGPENPSTPLEKAP